MFMFPPFPLLSKVIQKLRTTQEGEVILIAYLPGGHHNHGFHIYYVFVWTTLSSFRTARTYVTTGICLGWQVVPSACLEALMQHYQTAGFSRRSLDLWQPLKDPQHTECATTGGFTWLTGPQDKELISLVPQLLK